MGRAFPAVRMASTKWERSPECLREAPQQQGWISGQEQADANETKGTESVIPGTMIAM